MSTPQPPLFGSVADVAERLAGVGYLASTAVATTVYLADRLGKPLLVEGPAGVGKTELAKAVAECTESGLVRLQCYEGIDEARALYEWNHAKQLLRITAGRNEESWDETRDDVFSEEFLLARPLLTAIRRSDPTVLLIDEMDKADVEVEGLLLEVLSDFQVTVPEMGTISATRRPFVLLTSNSTRELSEALKRRCLFLHLDFPDADLERRIGLVLEHHAQGGAHRVVVERVEAQREQRAAPVDGLGDRRQLAQVHGAQRGDHADHGAGQRQVQAAALERLGQLAGRVRGQHDHRPAGGGDRAELGDGHLEV